MSRYAGLSLANTPPLKVPLRFFLVAPWFLGAAGLLLLLADPVQWQGRWTPAWLGLTHLWVLGFMLAVMLGALQQVVPILLGSALPAAERVSRWGRLLFAPGVLFLALGLFTGCLACQPVAALLLPAAVLLVAIAALVAILRSPSEHPSRLSLALALFSLLVTLALGGWLLLGHAGWWPLPRSFTDLHLAWGLLGWTVLLLTGVAWQVVPMFQITPRYPALLMRWFAPVFFLALLVWSAARWWLHLPWLVVGGEVLLSTLQVLFALATLWLQSRRRRRIPDATLDFWRLAMVALLLANGLWWLHRAGVAVPEVLPVMLFAAGFVGSAILGMLYKILPFLVWLHLTSRAQVLGLVPRGLPNMNQVIPSSRPRLLFRLYLAWLLLLTGLPWWPRWIAYPSAALLLLVAVLLETHLLGAVRIHRSHRKRLEAEAAGR